MSRYIDADEFYTKLSEWSLIHGAVTRGEMGLILETMHHIDIVFCKECINGKIREVDGTKQVYCKDNYDWWNLDGYCSHGEPLSEGKRVGELIEAIVAQSKGVSDGRSKL